MKTGTVVEFSWDKSGDLLINTVSLEAAGVKISGDDDGAITFLGLGDGSDEDLTINLDDVANTAGITSSTGLILFDWGAIGADYGDAGSFEIVNATGCTVDAAGEICEDTTDNQLIYGAAPEVLNPEFTICVVIEDLKAADDNLEITMLNDAWTVTAVGLHCAGTCTTGADISLEDRSGNAMTHTVPTHSTGTGNSTFQAVTSAGGLVAGEGLRFDVDNAVDPETDDYTICVQGTWDRQ